MEEGEGLGVLRGDDTSRIVGDGGSDEYGEKVEAAAAAAAGIAVGLVLLAAGGDNNGGCWVVRDFRG